MDSKTTATPPYHHNSGTKSASRLAQTQQIPHLCLGLITSSPKRTPSPSAAHSRKSPDSLPIRELLLLSPSPLGKRSKTRLADRLEMADDEPSGSGPPRRRCKSRATQMGLLGCASPRNTRRSRRRSEIDKDSPLMVEEIAKPRRKRGSKSKKDTQNLVPCLPLASPSSSSIEDKYRGSLDRFGQLINDLIMWRDVARSSLWFGLGSLFFFSSCFAGGVRISMFSAISQAGLVFLVASFVSSSISQRNGVEEKKHYYEVKEEDIVGVAKMIVITANLAMSKTRAVFSGEAGMTLKVAPLFVLGAEYGHLISLWALSMLAFFISFTIPKLYSCYSIQMDQKVDYLKWWVLETWRACSHKKIVAASAATAFWNLSSLKTRIFTAFISLVIIRYCRQQYVMENENTDRDAEHQLQPLLMAEVEVEAEAEAKAEEQGKLEQQQQQALVVVQVEASCSDIK